MASIFRWVTKSRTLRAVMVALVLIAIAAVWPIARAHRARPNKADVMVTSIADLKGTALQHRDGHLAELRAKGYKTGTTQVFHASMKRHWWERLTARLHADDYYQDDGYVSVTDLDDGDPNTGEFFTYATNYTTGAEIWGGVQWDDSSNTWTFWEGASGPFAKAKLGPLDQLACRLTSVLYAKPDNCGGGWVNTRDILLSGVHVGIATTGGNFSAGCRTYGCLGWSFYWGFVSTVYWDTFELAYWCYFSQ